MKKLLILPGHSPRNKAWGEECAKELGGLFATVHLQNYDHWEVEGGKINFSTEIEKISKTVEGSEGKAGDWYIVAKSIGTLLAIQAKAELAIKPVKAVFFGIPLDLASQDLFKDSWSPLINFGVPSLVFHNDEDPTANYEFTKNKLAELASNFTFVTLKGNNHDYLDFADYLPAINNFLKIDY